MKIRPTSVTVICWILIVINAISLISSTVMINNPVARDLMEKSPISVPIQIAMLYAGLLISLTCAIAMLNGKSWGRLLYVIWTSIAFIVGLITSPMKFAMIPGVVIFGIIVFFLFRPKANYFFSAAPAGNENS